ncbi:uncharacterized protein BO72DRAFT_440154 [Aspergillus fijiensis CBS 313.89]|uniref:C2H2-type domain-containing protein n=1 Tax=Aspergillus fijiensis CBS 313.89 TaxID=1448319 RepID=A0A8G1VUL5_9EURO|nr:uncharacterized protein BO72DRAFT_440154 [Aspergillus fijiensis CBS 313.89]RAK72256.1 hypothetical protein BO72DRAFT_440154 [Aspergillus fijiensis CBS 313.89]
MELSSVEPTQESSSAGKRKPRICSYCERSFRRYEHLQRHLRIHTHEKPYECDCGATFSRRDLLKRHQNIGHAPITPSTEDPSPAEVHNTSNVQSQVEYSHSNFQSSLPELADLHDIAQVLPSQTSQYPNVQLEGNPLFSSQDLLVLQDLEMFSNNMGLNNEWYLPTEPSITQIFAGDSSFNLTTNPSTAPASGAFPVGPDQALSKLPTEREAVAEFGVLTLPILTVTNQHRERLLRALTRAHSIQAANDLPSCHSLSRFANGFFDGFYPHYPMVHIPTFRIDECEPECLLAMCALGAEFRHENRKAVLLFQAATDILQQRTRETQRTNAGKAAPSGNSTTPLHQGSVPDHKSAQYRETMRDARCAFLLIAFATWQGKDDLAREAFNLQSFLARCIRECQLEQADQGPDASATDWRSWVQEETDRRIKLFSFALLNLQSLAFGTPSVILTDEIRVRLPCSCLEWIAPSSEKWNRIRTRPGFREQMMFQDALCHIMKNPPAPGFPNAHPVPSPQANYILLHALIQQILLAYRALGPYNDANKSLINGQKEIMRHALHAWTSLWQRAPESSLDPRNPNGPVTFTSTAFLGVAYVRLGLDIGSYRILRSRDANEIASRLLQMPRLPAGPHLLPAILHATHALSIPVKLGVNFVAQSHAFVWSIQHSLCGLEFAIFLSKWLFCIADCQTRRPLDEHETRLVSWITDIVEEGRTSGDEDLWARPSIPSDCVYLGFAVAKLWARLIRGNEQWLLLKIIGDGLDIYADTCDRDSVRSQTGSSVAAR